MAAPTNDENLRVELGFLEVTEAWKLKSKYFPSKVGGKPAWLNLRDLPTDTKCESCAGPLVFLLQIYAPVSSLDSCFHRTIFVFYCEKAGCCQADAANRSFVAFRCQLPRQNEFYSYEPPVESEEDSSSSTPVLTASDFGPLCAVCGGRGPKRCARCHSASYCSREHQILDWKAGHKGICKEGASDYQVPLDNVQLLPEFEIVTEEEELGCIEDKKIERKEEIGEEKLEPERLNPEDVKDLEDMASSRDDKQFRRFRKRIDLDPEQVLRFQRAGSPLWVSRVAIPGESDIEKCICGSSRQFEFQILPQLLNHLKLDDTKEASVDWGTLAVYTCSQHCDTTHGYIREFVWKQDFFENLPRASFHNSVE